MLQDNESSQLSYHMETKVGWCYSHSNTRLFYNQCYSLAMSDNFTDAYRVCLVKLNLQSWLKEVGGCVYPGLVKCHLTILASHGFWCDRVYIILGWPW